MAFSGPTFVAEVQSSSTVASLSTSPFTAPAGALIFVLGQASKLSPAPATLAVSDTEGLTWTSRSGAQTVGSGIAVGLGHLWDAESNGNETTVTITPSASCLRWTFQVGYFTADGTISFVQAKQASGDNTTPTVTLDATPGADSFLLAGLLTNGANAITEDGDYTAGSEVMTSAGNNCSGNVSYRNGSTGGDATVTLAIAATQQWDLTLGEYAEDAGGGDTELAVADAAHGHSADNLGLIQQATIAVADASHAHTADAVALIEQAVLAVAESSHAHAADAVALLQQNLLAVADALHGHQSDNVDLVQQATLAVQEALHAHAADGIVLDISVALVVADATHAHATDSPALLQAYVIAVADALHAHSADALALVQANLLAVGDALHAHAADGVVLVVDGEGFLIDVEASLSIVRTLSASLSVVRTAEADLTLTRTIDATLELS